LIFRLVIVPVQYLLSLSDALIVSFPKKRAYFQATPVF